jgi:ABC-type antimicrobial peptide transport system permease subunit
MKGRFIGLILGAIVGFAVMCSICEFVYAPIYNGKISLTEAQYSVFKETIAQKDVTVVSINVLNSNEPIVVIFEVCTKSSFPYGNKTMNPRYLVIPMGMILGSSLGFVAGALWEKDNG